MKTAPKNHNHFQGFSPLNYTQTPDQFFDEVAPFLSEAQLKVMLYVIRRTYGFKKDADKISLNQMLNGIVTKEGKRLDYGVGVKKKALLKALNWLEENGYIIRTRNKNLKQADEATTFSLNIANVTTPGVQKTPPTRSPKNTRGRSLKDTTQETVKQKTVKQEYKNSSIENSETENEKTESRGGGFKSFQDIMEAKKEDLGKRNKTSSIRTSNESELGKTSIGDRILVQETPPAKNVSQSLTGLSKLETVMVKISQDIGDQKHERENRKQVKNIFSKLESRGVTEDQFIGTLFDVRGLTLEIGLDRPGAYFFKVLRDRWKISPTS